MLALLPQIQKFCPNAQLVDNAGQFWYGVISLDGVTRFWAIKGTMQINGKNYIVAEGGDLVDRITQPSYYEDNNPDSTKGGTVLHYRIDAEPDEIDGYPGIVNFYWNKE